MGNDRTGQEQCQRFCLRTATQLHGGQSEAILHLPDGRRPERMESGHCTAATVKMQTSKPRKEPDGQPGPGPASGPRGERARRADTVPDSRSAVKAHASRESPSPNGPLVVE